MTDLELLSPAGDIEIFKAVVDAGADAVYFGGDLFGARAFAKNFSISEAKEAIKYAHLHSAKAYLTVNTLLKNTEIENKLYNYLKEYVEAGIDAFIVQDFGVFSFIKSFFPNTEIHASTQMSLCTKYGAEFIQSAGASRIVTARELSLKEISKIHEACPSLEIESFIHGALCVCYSGQCLMSSIIGARSGNRGRCAQPCRLPYQAYDKNGNKLNTGGEYLLSPKDFCTIESLPVMIEAGVSSFKIEGRMKQLSYAKGVVAIYRHYIDKFLTEGKDNYRVLPSDYDKLLNLGNRCGFTDLYLKNHNGKEMMTFLEPSHTKTNENVSLSVEKKIAINCNVVAKLGQPLLIEFFDNNGICGSYTGELCNKADKRAATKEDIEKAVLALGNTCFSIEKLNIDMEDGLFLPVSALKNGRREAIEAYENQLLKQDEKIIKPYVSLEADASIEKRNKTDSLVVNVQNLEQLKIVEDFDFVKAVYVPVALLMDALEMSEKDVFAVLPPIIRDENIKQINLNSGEAGVLVSSFDGLGYLESISYPKENIVLDTRLYTFSNRAIAAFEDAGYMMNCIPYELSLKELLHRNNSNSQFIIYSTIPLMVTANCTIKNSLGCTKKNDTYSLVDRKKASFKGQCNCDYCYNTIYNSKKYCAFSLSEEISSLKVREYRIDFTFETKAGIEQILNKYKDIFIDNKHYEYFEDCTKGHLKRGVD